MFRRRIRILQAAVAIAFVGLIVRLYGLQVVEGDTHAREALRLRTHIESIPAVRGTIYDRTGVPLVFDEQVYHLGIRVAYYWRASPSGIVASVLDAVRRAIPEHARPPEVAMPDVVGRPGVYLRILLDTVTKEHVLRIPGRRFRHELYQRLCGLFDIASRADLVRALEQAAGADSLGSVLGRTIDPRCGPLCPDPYPLALRKLETERDRMTHLAATYGDGLADLTGQIEAAIRWVEEQVARRIASARAGAAQAGEGLDPEQASGREKQRAMRDYPFRRRILRRDIARQAALYLYLNEQELPGLFVREDRRRGYRPCTPIALTGWPREVQEEEIATARRILAEGTDGKPKGRLDVGRFHRLTQVASLEPGQRLGAERLERAFDWLLRGRPGRVRILRDFLGKEEEALEHVPAQDGCDLHLTLDIRLQEEAERILQDALGDWQSGCIVLVDPDTGEVLAMASHPRPDPMGFPAAYDTWLKDERQPLKNRCIQLPDRPYPGSTFKPVVAAAGLAEGVIDQSRTFYCRGYMKYPGSFRCLGTHNAVDLREAIVKSCNVLFYHLGEELGGTALAHWARQFGFGQPTGIELMEEDAGRVRSPESKPGRWVPADARFLAIGQVNVEATPLQVLRMVAAVGNGGSVVPAHLVGKRAGSDTSREVHARKLELPPRILEVLGRMLEGVVSPGGTASDCGLDRLHAAGKTGTAETGGLPDHAWFAGYAPAERPEIAVVVFLEYAGAHGGEVAAPLAAEILKEYFRLSAGGRQGG